MNNKTIKYFKELLEYVTYYNRMAPFPVFDTEYVSLIETKLKEMKNKQEEYDSIPVASCKHCKDLHIQCDDEENDICMRCGSINEIVIHNNIDEYLKYKNESN